MTRLAETLGKIQPGERAHVTVDDDSTIEGDASLVTYNPEDRLRVEIEESDDSRIRHDVRAEYENGEWTTPKVRRYAPEQDGWVVVGTVTDVDDEGV